MTHFRLKKTIQDVKKIVNEATYLGIAK